MTTEEDLFRAIRQRTTPASRDVAKAKARAMASQARVSSLLRMPVSLDALPRIRARSMSQYEDHHTRWAFPPMGLALVAAVVSYQLAEDRATTAATDGWR